MGLRGGSVLGTLTISTSLDTLCLLFSTDCLCHSTTLSLPTLSAHSSCREGGGQVRFQGLSPELSELPDSSDEELAPSLDNDDLDETLE